MDGGAAGADDMTASVLLLGESPPPKAPPDFIPFDCQSGTNLARFLGLKSRAEVLAHLPRANCFDVPTGVSADTPKWDKAQARLNAEAEVVNRPTTRTVVALGRRAADALGMADDAPALTWQRLPHLDGVDALHVPHPSGRSTSLNTEAKRAEARQAMLVEVVLGCPTLRPWHFRLDEPAVLADLGAALCPLRPALGVAACVLMAEIKAHHERVTAAGFIGEKHATIAAEAGKRLIAVNLPMVQVALLAAHDLPALADAFGLPVKRGLMAQAANAERTMPEVSGYPSAVARAIYGRHVALGVAP
jgi:uracil-DNA glycosylase